jgi:hypothetical protein
LNGKEEENKLNIYSMSVKKKRPREKKKEQKSKEASSYHIRVSNFTY